MYDWQIYFGDSVVFRFLATTDRLQYADGGCGHAIESVANVIGVSASSIFEKNFTGFEGSR